MVKMTIHRALAEIKLYEKKINEMYTLNFITTYKKSAKTVSGMTKEELRKSYTSNFDKITSYIKNRDKLKTAVIRSNAETKITIDGVTYTVAEAIERKNSIKHEENFLNYLTRQWVDAKNKITSYEASFETNFNRFLESFSKNTNPSPEQVKEYEHTYRELNDLQFIDPNNLEETIATMKSKIEGFKTNVDFALSESNAITVIEVDID